MKELQDKTQPMTIHDIITGLPAPEEDNLKHLLEPAQEPTTDEQDDKETRDDPTPTPNQSDNNNQTTEQEVPEQPLGEQVERDEPDEEDANDGDYNKNNEDPDEFVMENIVAHRKNKSTKHPHASVGELLYRIRWTGYRPSDDTWEPIIHIPPSHVLRYHKQKKLAIPSNIARAIDG